MFARPTTPHDPAPFRRVVSSCKSHKLCLSFIVHCQVYRGGIVVSPARGLLAAPITPDDSAVRARSKKPHDDDDDDERVERQRERATSAAIITIYCARRWCRHANTKAPASESVRVTELKSNTPCGRVGSRTFSGERTQFTRKSIIAQTRSQRHADRRLRTQARTGTFLFAATTKVTESSRNIIIRHDCNVT